MLSANETSKAISMIFGVAATIILGAFLIMTGLSVTVLYLLITRI